MLALDRSDIELTFPGRHSFSGIYRGKPAVRRWLERFCAIGFQIEPTEVVAVGPPWRTTVSVRCHVWLPDDDGGLVYDTRAVIWGHLRWGKLARYEVFEDTELASTADAWIAEYRPEFAAAVPTT